MLSLSSGADTPFSMNARLNIRFGRGVVANLAREVKALGGARVFFVADKGVRDAGLTEQPLTALREAGIEFEAFYDAEQNPRDTTIEEGVKLLEATGADVVIGFGGGSAMDAAKGIALLATNGGKLADYDGIDKIERDTLPLVAIPTTAGTGSEVTANAAITNSTRHYKMSIRSPRLLPSLAIVDPDLLRSLPHMIAATSGVDALVHAIEGYLSLRASPLSDVFALEAMRLLHANLRPFVANPANIEAASAMALGSLLAGVVISNTGTGNDHAIARALGGVCDMPHGLATSVVLAPVLRFNALARPGHMARLAECFGLDVPPSRAAAAVVEEVESLLGDLRIPNRLGSLGVSRNQIPEIVDIAFGNVGPNPRKTSKDDLTRLIEEVF